MRISRRNPFSGEVHTKEFNITETQYQNWVSGMLIQRAMPNLSPDDREFIMTGMLPSDWHRIFGTEKY